tara:strand:+ start:415 stop:1494 length:1080 start_codon:yes stop_codon:yes gene_type:complete
MLPRPAKTHVTLHDSIIHRPDPNVIYHLKSDVTADDEIIVEVDGDDAKKYSYFDVATGNYDLIKGTPGQVFCDKFIWISNESLFGDDRRLPVFCHDGISKFSMTFNVKLRLENNTTNATVSSHPLTNQPTSPDNTELSNACQRVAGQTPVSVGNYPIYLPGNKPSYKALAGIYQQFISYNTDLKLTEQYLNTAGYCHMRAHFAVELLGLYGVSSVKVFKFWNPTDWKQHDISRSWKFHAAVMVIDEDNNQWVFDPWVGLNHQLQTLKQWLHQKDEPTPINLLITHCLSINPETHGHTVYGSRISQHTAAHINAFRAVCGDAIPNPPPPLIAKHSLFKPQLALIKYEDRLDTLKKHGLVI